MPNKCSVGFCKTNYAGHPTHPVYKFPSDERECEIWMNALPNRIEVS